MTLCKFDKVRQTIPFGESLQILVKDTKCDRQNEGHFLSFCHNRNLPLATEASMAAIVHKMTLILPIGCNKQHHSSFCKTTISNSLKKCRTTGECCNDTKNSIICLILANLPNATCCQTEAPETRLSAKLNKFGLLH